MASSTPYTLPRAIIGPLTSTFSAPPSCATLNIDFRYDDTDQDFLSIYPYGKTCALSGTVIDLVDIPTCFPCGLAEFMQTSSGFVAFSPASDCPSRWSTVGTATKNAAHSMAGYAIDWAPYMEPEESLALCCPSGYTSSFGQDYGATPRCYSTVTPGQSIRGGSYEVEDGQCSGVRVTERATQTIIVSQDAINLIHRPAAATDVNESATGGAEDANGGGNEDTSSDSGLSTGAKAAIGTVVPVVVLALIAAGLLLWFRIRPKKRLAQNNTHVDSYGKSIEGSGDIQVGNGSYKQPETSQPQWWHSLELDTGRGTELSDGRSDVRELDTHTSEQRTRPSELVA